MALKLNSSGGGSVTVQEPTTASNLTLTLPAVTGKAAYTDASDNLQVNSGYGSYATGYVARAWVNFNGTGTVAIRASGNVSSITDNGTGNYTVNFTTAMPDVNYAAQLSIGSISGGSSDVIPLVATPSSTSSVQVFSVQASFKDAAYVGVSIFR